MSGPEKKQIKQKIADLTRHLIYYEVTEVLLNRFRTVSFQLYEEIDELKDAKGRSVDVYVKFLPEDSALPSYGIVSLVPSAIDTTACNSEYGAGSASIRIRTTNKALRSAFNDRSMRAGDQRHRGYFLRIILFPVVYMIESR